jgi:hypothetical protein
MPIMASLAELIGSSATYSANYGWFVDLARKFHTIQDSHTLNTPVRVLFFICFILFLYISQ